ncbi:MAG: hypothetical protein ACE5GU_14120 [Candidatus Scalinduaceae bacterium]
MKIDSENTVRQDRFGCRSIYIPGQSNSTAEEAIDITVQKGISQEKNWDGNDNVSVCAGMTFRSSI